MIIQEPVQAAVWHCLNHYDYGDAIFLAERLLAEIRSDDCVFLVATCYYRAGQVDQAYHVLQRGGLTTPQNKFLFAKCAVDLKKDSEAESVLVGKCLDPRKEISIADMTTEFGEKAAFALRLLSGIYDRSERKQKALDAERKALKLNPFLWKSFETLCNNGEFIPPSKAFDLDNTESFSYSHGVNPLVNFINGCQNTSVNSNNLNSEQGKRTVPDILIVNDKLESISGQQQSGGSSNPLTCRTMNSSNNPQVANTVGSSGFHPPVTGTPQQVSPNLHTSSVSHPANATLGTPINFVTPKQAPQQHLMETPLLHCNSISTPMSSLGGGHNISTSSMGSHISGICTLNLTPDNDALNHRNVTSGRMPAPVKPKPKRCRRAVPPASNLAPSFPSFGVLGQTGRVFARALEFSSPQLVFLSPATPPTKSSLTSTPNNTAENRSSLMINPEESPRAVKRMAMANKPDNQKQSVLGQSPGNVITSVSQNSLPTRRSSRLYGSTQSVKENSKAPGKNRISAKSPSRKTNKTRGLRNDRQMSESERNEKNKAVNENQPVRKEILESDSKPEKPVDSKTQQTSQQPTLSVHSQAIQPQATCANMSDEGVKMQKSSVIGLFKLLQQFGDAYIELSRYNCRNAIKLLTELPPHHAKSSWCLAQIGKCYFEMNEYRKAQSYFRRVRDQDPNLLDMMEYYSTTLWHLQDDVELSSLAQELTTNHKLSPAAWCAAGNCFSHQKEHENAIRVFLRAVQVDARFAYAYTLLGHEYVLVEELDKALACFRSAVRLDDRHYNAWYGIGLTYVKQQRFQLAEIYFRKALAINPHSPILMCHVAVVQHSMKRSEKAISTLRSAIELAPRNPLCKFELASILHSMERYQEALQELNQLKDIVPKESPVFFLLGKVHKKLGNTHLALMHFSWAMDLDPKGANSQIKDALNPASCRTDQDSADDDDISLNRDGITGNNQLQHTEDGLMGEDSVFGENFSDSIEPELPGPASIDNVLDLEDGLSGVIDATPTSPVRNQSDESL